MIAEICVSLLLLAVAAQARLLQGTLTFENDQYVVEINGNSNVPFYTFYHIEAPDDKYRMQLQKMYELENGQNVGGSLISLPNLLWTIEEIDGENLAFWMNATGNNANFDDFEVMAFRNELQGRTIKYDFILDGYIYTSDTADSLNLEWKLSNATGSSGSPYISEEDEICYFGGQGTEDDAVCVDIVSTAQATNAGTVTDIAVTLIDSGGFVVVSYEKFEGNLFHDPEFGSKNAIGTPKPCFLC